VVYDIPGFANATPSRGYRRNGKMYAAVPTHHILGLGGCLDAAACRRFSTWQFNLFVLTRTFEASIAVPAPETY
jgi:hypothetical protein